MKEVKAKFIAYPFEKMEVSMQQKVRKAYREFNTDEISVSIRHTFRDLLENPEKYEKYETLLNSDEECFSKYFIGAFKYKFDGFGLFYKSNYTRCKIAYDLFEFYFLCHDDIEIPDIFLDDVCKKVSKRAYGIDIDLSCAFCPDGLYPKDHPCYKPLEIFHDFVTTTIEKLWKVLNDIIINTFSNENIDKLITLNEKQGNIAFDESGCFVHLK